MEAIALFISLGFLIGAPGWLALGIVLGRKHHN